MTLSSPRSISISDFEFEGPASSTGAAAIRFLATSLALKLDFEPLDRRDQEGCDLTLQRPHLGYGLWRDQAEIHHAVGVRPAFPGRPFAIIG
jgi:hypothetical protein